jgi:hypothetical protein
MVKTYKKLFFSLLFLSLYAGAVVFATPPGSGYAPGETLDPSCAPGDTNCSVLLSSYTAGNGIQIEDGEISWADTLTTKTITVPAFNTFSIVNYGTPSNRSELNMGFGYVNMAAYDSSNTLDSSVLVYPAAVELFNRSQIELDAPLIELIGNAVVFGTNRYLNFDTASGSNGYGFRDNGGVIQWKNSGGSWANITGGGGTFNGDYYSLTSLPTLFDGDYNSLSNTPYIPQDLSDLADNNGLIKYDLSELTDNNGLLTAGWDLTGNSGTDPDTNFIGTIDDVDFEIRRNNIPIARLHEDRILIGLNSGENTIGIGVNVEKTIFIGNNAGYNAGNSYYSNFFGDSAGYGALNANSANFFGAGAGYGATDAIGSNFFGRDAGYGATDASYSIFIGSNSGYQATNATHSNFFGLNAGMGAINASYSNIFGYNTGTAFIGNNVGSNNIIIGTNISLPDATADSINIGGVLFGTGTYNDTNTDPLITENFGGRIGILSVSPVATLDINGDAILSGTDRYLNFGTDSGTLGYGFRDNGGTLEWKDNAGSWAAFGGSFDGDYYSLTSLPTLFDGDYNSLSNTPYIPQDLSELTDNNGLLNGNGSGWGLTGNTGTTAGTNFIGTTDNQDVVIKRNNLQIARFFNETVFLSSYAGYNSTEVYYSNFIGENSGRNSTGTINSNFIGTGSGYNAASVEGSNFFGVYAGYGAASSNYSNFIGYSAGQSATNTLYSNFLGFQAGKSFFQNNIGSNNIIIGTNISLPDATANALNLGGVLFGTGTYSTTTGNPSITPVSGGRIGIGVALPASTLDVNGDTIISGSSRYLNFGTASGTSGYGFRDNAGTLEWKNNAGSWAAIPNPGWGLTGNAGTTAGTNFIGTTDAQDVVIKRNSVQIARFYSDRLFSGINAGSSATNANDSNFFGNAAGQNATNANNSNFFGNAAGYGATSANYSNFFGRFSGRNATNSSYSNFIGYYAGDGATIAQYSNFIGYESGLNATDASGSNFFGNQTGYGANNATRSNLFGSYVGKTFTGNNIGSNNIIIGTNISLPNATANAINLGGVLFGTGTYATITGDPSITPVSGGRIGIGVVSPSYTLQVGNSGVSGIVARFQNSTGTCDINPTTTALVCSSDQTLKSNITSLDSSLASLSALRPVTYTWNGSASSPQDIQVGFIAQEVEQVFPHLVFTDPTTGLKSLAYTNLIPYTVKAIQDINLSLTTLEDTDTSNPFRDAMTRWFSSASNGIESLFTKKVITEELCVGTTESHVCLNKGQIETLLNSQTQPSYVPLVVPEVPDEAIEEVEVIESEIVPEQEVVVEEAVLEEESM